MADILFLGTGPAGGNMTAAGRSRRSESSALVVAQKINLLIDVTQFFQQQVKQIDRIDGVLITHGHRDACGGIPHLDVWLEKRNKRITVYTLAETIGKIKEFSLPKHIDFVAVKPFVPFTLADISVIPLPVEHSMQQGFPTLGFFIETEGNFLAYVSDVARWSAEAETYMRKADTLIPDGSMWHTKIASHITLDEMLPTFCGWENKRIIITHVGKASGVHEQYEQEVRRICPKARVAYDGLRLSLKT